MLKSRGRGMHHSLLSPGTGDFTHFHWHKKGMPGSAQMGGGVGVSNDWCIMMPSVRLEPFL